MFVLLSEKCIEDFSLSKKIMTNSLSTNKGEVIGTFLLLKKCFEYTQICFFEVTGLL